MVRGLIQTDRPMPPDADGGALADGDGDVVGMCVRLESEDGIGMAGYAVPIDVATAVADDLVAHGRIRRAWLGVEGDNLDADEAAELGLDGGAVVEQVANGGPADASGLASGDVVVAVDGVPVNSMEDLAAAVSAHRPGQRVILAYRRDGSDGIAVVILAEKAR
jgi:S1-C subfamily serine protease